MENYSYSVNDGFRLIALINDEYRARYTKKIVGDGKKVGLNFDENWLDNEVEVIPCQLYSLGQQLLIWRKTLFNWDST